MRTGGGPARHLAADGRPPATPGAPTTPGAARRSRRFVPAVERWNRFLLLAAGLLLLAAGVVVLLAGAGVFGAAVENRPVLGPDVRSFAAGHGWFWPALGVVLGLLALCAVGWLAAQLRTGRLRGLFVTDDALGGVRVGSAALADAVVDDLVGNPVVRAARVVVRGRPRRPVLQMSIETDAGADARALRADVEGRVLPRARRALGRPDLAGEIEIGVDAGSPARVR
ncbi:alkaline shock response membrane anchor protein AmaP [Frankia sp. Cpl3]|uniref:alkaline shock response membrane anchor protein AmaP n=1 Tax=Parafrankia colletiae TaxID=573497 RepID=UPI000AA94F05|nr:alkaline shock response membrane anchor protein AmaP [Parafrankia colletiae]MCK9900310.1 alkaline shock response membrane anchor protein AmaP [Frankia sp. Cpl3]